MITAIATTISAGGLAAGFALGCGVCRRWLEREEGRRRNGW
jgi:hypothetical protein